MQNNNAAEVLPALDLAEEHLDIYITVASVEHDCNTAYLLRSNELNGDTIMDRIHFMSDRLLEHIEEIKHASSEE